MLCGILGHLRKSCKVPDTPQQGEEGEEFGLWLRAEEGDFSLINEGNFLHRVENLRKDYFDSYSREELGLDEEGTTKP